MITVNTINFDSVIDSHYLTGTTDYDTAVNDLYPLINRLDIQRKTQNEKFYKRLERDLQDGCIMPPLTIAYVEEEDTSKYKKDDWEKYINDNISKGFILDGIQRLYTLHRVHEKGTLNLDNPLFMNIVICKSRDNLLYRMVTLNNGQKPMTARHQIEILASNLYDFKKYDLNIITEKDSIKSKPKKAFKKADFISAYISFLSNSVNLESSKIIESKMDELIAKKILESNITQKGNVAFGEVLKEVSRLSKDDEAYKWLKVNNNLIGFVVGLKTSVDSISKLSVKEFVASIEVFEEAFSWLDVSKIKLSRERRKLSKHFISNYEKLKEYSPDDLLLEFNEIELE